MNPQKAKGSAFERLIATYLAEAIACERIPAGATLDRGDLWTPQAAIQCKAVRSLSLGAWLDQTHEQQRNAGKPLGFLVVKRRGTTDPGSQFAICSTSQLRALLHQLQ
ncbi:MAG: hypothetical protein WCF98_10260 [Synechococcus sp. ELA057]